MDELDEWRRHLGLPVEIELENPYGEKFKVKMKPLEGEDRIDLLMIGKELGDNPEKNKDVLNKENIKKLVNLMMNSITNIPEEIKEDIIGKYFFDLFPELFNLNFQVGKETNAKNALNKQNAIRKRMEELRRNDGKSPEDSKG